MITYEKIGNIDDFLFVELTGKVSFTLNDGYYEFDMSPFYECTVAKDPDYAVYYGKNSNNDLECSLVKKKSNNYITAKINLKNDPAKNAIENEKDHFIIINADQDELNEALKLIPTNSAIQNQKKDNLMEMAQLDQASSASYATYARLTLHVLAAGDGVSLYTRFFTPPTNAVWDSPVNPPAGVQNVSGIAYDIEILEGQFEAKNSKVVMIGNIPLINTDYDNCNVA